MTSYSHLPRPEAEPLLPSLGHPTALTSKPHSWRATSFLRVVLLALCPVVILSFISRTAQRHIIFWPCIIIFIAFAINLTHILLRFTGKTQNDRKALKIAIGVLVDILCTVAVTIAMYVVTWKRPRADRAESLIALVMGFVIGLVPLIVAGATYFQMDYDISFTPRKSVQLPLETSEDEVSFESSHIKYSTNMET